MEQDQSFRLIVLNHELVYVSSISTNPNYGPYPKQFYNYKFLVRLRVFHILFGIF